MVEKKPFGSGYFGEWIEDEYGMPAYRYTCNQLKDPKAFTPMNEKWHRNTDHFFLVGNDRVVGVASNYGHIRLRQDEESPKYSNAFLPESNQYSGGFGYLSDGESCLSTYYTGTENSFERVFGIGYMRKIVSDNKYYIDQVIMAPFGDDPLLISQVKIKNNSDRKTNLKWYEYWGCFNYQFSMQSVLEAIQKKDSNRIHDYRIELEKKNANKTQIFGENQGLINFKYDPKSSFKEKQLDLTARLNGNLVQKKRPVFEDRNPPPVFLISLDDKSSGFCNVASKFFGSGTVDNPEGINSDLNYDENYTDSENCLILEREIRLEPGEEKALFFAYGYIPEGFNLESLLLKYQGSPQQHLKKSCEQWKEKRLSLKTKDDSWIDRELFWHYYYLRGCLTYDNFFTEHILSQGHVYQYIIGFQGAARDPLQHALPFIYTDPEIVKEIIRYTLKEVKKNGEIPYGICGSGMIMPALWIPSDLELWLIWLTSEYVLSSRDIDFLEEEISMYPIYSRKQQKMKVREIIAITYRHFIEVTGQGKHGLSRVRSCDWNDMIITGFVPEEFQNEVRNIGESVLNSSMAVYVLSLHANMLNFIGDHELAEEVQIIARSLIEPIKKTWNGKWFKRAWLSEELGWVGENKLWLEPQPWTFISEIVDDDQKETLIKSINELVRFPSQIGAILISNTVDKANEPAGMATNAGIWASINGTLIWALSKYDGNMAFDEWKKNSLAYKASVYPDIWYVIWSGPDTLNSVFSEFPGHTLFNKYYLTLNPEDHHEGLLSMGINWTDFPVLNLHPHAWPLYNIGHLLGITFTEDGVEFAPTLPKEEYSFTSSLIGFEKKNNSYTGWYDPLRGGTWKIRIKLPEHEKEMFNTILINGKQDSFTKDENSIIWEGESSQGKPLRWEIK